MRQRNLGFLALGAVLLSIPMLAGCQTSDVTPAPVTTPAASSTGAAPGANRQKGNSMGIGLAPAPAGAKTDLSGGLNAPGGATPR